MTMTSNNGYTVFEGELRDEPEAPFGETAFEAGWESSFESSFEEELGAFETGPSQSGYETGPYETGYETYEAGFEAGPYESAYETGYEAGYEAGPYESGYESAFEQEVGEGEAWESVLQNELDGLGRPLPSGGAYEEESDQFLPLIGLAASALPSIIKAAGPLVRRLLPVAGRAVGNVVRAVASRPAPRAPLPPFAQPGRPVAGPAQGARAGARPARDRGTLLRRLASVLGEGESVAAEAESSLFGSAESQYEVGPSSSSHEAALTEVLAAEAAHTASLAEAQAMLGAALPITIRIMGARRVAGPYLPALTSANTRLVRALATRGPEERQLLRSCPPSSDAPSPVCCRPAEAGAACHPVPWTRSWRVRPPGC
jgi:hypothetical protein